MFRVLDEVHNEMVYMKFQRDEVVQTLEEIQAAKNAAQTAADDSIFDGCSYKCCCRPFIFLNLDAVIAWQDDISNTNQLPSYTAP